MSAVMLRLLAVGLSAFALTKGVEAAPKRLHEVSQPLRRLTRQVK